MPLVTIEKEWFVSGLDDFLKTFNFMQKFLEEKKLATFDDYEYDESDSEIIARYLNEMGEGNYVLFYDEHGDGEFWIAKIVVRANPVLHEWKKTIDRTDLIVWQNCCYPKIQVTFRWNPVIRRWQLYASDGDITIFDFGEFRHRKKDLALQKAEFWMKTFSPEQYLNITTTIKEKILALADSIHDQIFDESNVALTVYDRARLDGLEQVMRKIAEELTIPKTITAV